MTESNSDRVWRGQARGGRACAALLAPGAGLAVAGAAFIELAWVQSGDNPIQAIALEVGVLLCAAALWLTARASTACRVVVRISVYVVEIRSGLLPLPGIRVPLRRIRTARTVLVPQPSWRGWGRRRSRHGHVIAVRPGPALELRLTSGQIIVVTVEKPWQAVAVLRQLGIAVGPGQHRA